MRSWTLLSIFTLVGGVSWIFKYGGLDILLFGYYFWLILIFVVIEWFGRNNEFPTSEGGKFSFVKTAALVAAIVLFGNYSDLNSFIYFQF